ncbi:glyoxalase [Actinocatenispora sera]|uniref:glyoxalase n=1 Tax=Actinocatenispora sera TaxID=390989 RepID=UPI0033F6FE87
MTAIHHLTFDVADTAAADAYYAAAFGVGDRIRVREGQPPTTGFRGFAVSLVVAQPSTVDSLMGTALAGGATALKPAAKSFWGYSSVLRDPYGVIWKIATSEKKNTGPNSRAVDDIVLLLGASDVAATKRYYVERGLPVAKSFGSKYVEFGTAPIKLALYTRRAAAKDLGVDAGGTGSHRLTIGADAGTFADPDAFAWAPALVPAHEH